MNHANCKRHKKLKNETNKLFDMNKFDEWFELAYRPVNCGGLPVPKIISFKWKRCTIFMYPTTIYESLARQCEVVRKKYLETKNEHYFDILVHLLPSSYKVVKL